MKGKIGSHQWHQQHKIPACQSHQWWILPLSVDRSTHRSTHTKGATCSNKIIKYCRNFCSCYCSYCSFKYNSNAPFKHLCVLIFIFSQSLVALISFTGRNTSILLPLVAYSLCAWRLLQFNYWKCFRLTIQAFAHIVCRLHFIMHLPLTRSNIE